MGCADPSDVEVDVVALWRRETAVAALRVLDQITGRTSAIASPSRR